MGMVGARQVVAVGGDEPMGMARYAGDRYRVGPIRMRVILEPRGVVVLYSSEAPLRMHVIPDAMTMTFNLVGPRSVSVPIVGRHRVDVAAHRVRSVAVGMLGDRVIVITDR